MTLRENKSSGVEVVPLEVAARVHAQLDPGDVAGLVGGQEQHRVADVRRVVVPDFRRKRTRVVAALTMAARGIGREITGRRRLIN